MATMIQNSFVGGEISPSLQGRSDLKAYYNSAARVENFVVTREGSLRKRRGIAACAKVTRTVDDLHVGVLMPEPSPRMFAYRYDRDDGGVVLVGNASPAEARILVRRKQLLAPSSIGSDDWMYASLGTALDENALARLQVTQIGDTLFVACQGVFLKKVLVDWAAVTLSVEDYEQSAAPAAPPTCSATAYNFDKQQRNVSYAAFVVKDGVMSPRKTTGATVSNTWTAGAYVSVSVGLPRVEPGNSQSAASTDFDYILLAKQIGGSYGEVARWYPEDVTDTDLSNKNVKFRDENISAGEAVYAQTNVLGENWATTGAPLCASAFQQRLVFANAPGFPMTLWFSEIGNLYNFYADRPAADDDAFSVTIHSTGPAFIRWLVTYQRQLIAFTDCGVYSVAGSTSEGFSASTCQVSKLSETACSKTVAPVETDSGIIFVGADDKTLYTMAYDIQSDSTLPQNQMLRVEHLTRGARILSVALRQFPFQVVWCVLSDGTALSFTYEKSQEVGAWARHRVDGGHLIDVVGLGAVSHFSSDGRTYSDIVFRVKNSVSAHEDEALAVFRDSDAFNDAMPGSDEAAPVVATLTTLRAESQDRTLAGVRKNVKDVLVKLHESGPLKVVPADSGLAPAVLADGEASFTGEAKAMPRGYLDDGGRMTFVSDSPTPCEITSIVYKMEVDG